MKTLATAIENRGVTRLIHFTPLLNLLHIMKSGRIESHLKVVERCKEDVDFRDVASINDSMRLDGKPNYINLSVQMPNSGFFRRCKERMGEKDIFSGGWYMISLKPECCLIDGTLFAVGNAASTHVKRFGTRSGVEGFEAMFAERIEVSRGGRVFVEQRTCNKPMNLTTSWQAEVMVPGNIPVNMIQCVYAENSESAIRLNIMLKCEGIDCSFPIEVDESLF